MTPPNTVALGARAEAARIPRTRGPLGITSPGIAALLPAIVAAAIYVPTLRDGWVWEDAALVASHGSRTAVPGFHPAVTALYRLEWLAGIGAAPFFHFTSLVLHAVGTWLFYLLLTGVGATASIALGVSLLFALDPIHTEAVAYVTGRPDLLATVCALGALVLARSAPVCTPEGCRSWRVWPAYALLAVAVLSDEVALVTPLLLIGLDRWGRPRVDVRGRTTVTWGFAAVAVAGILARAGDHALHLNEPHELLAKGTGIWGPVIAAYEFLRAMVFPFQLNAMRSLSEAEAASGSLRLEAVAALAGLALFILLRRRDPLARTGALIFFLTLLPALPIGPFQGAYVEERAAYFPSVGLCFLVGSIYTAIAGRARGSRIAAATLAALVAIGAGAVTAMRLPVWTSNVALLQDALRHDPKDPATHLALADQYVAEGNLESALASIDRAVALDSTRAESWHKKTLVLNRMGKLDQAEAAARRAVSLRPGEAIFWANLGDLLTREGRKQEAVSVNRRAVLLEPGNAENWYNLGVSLAATDSLGPAIQAYQRAIAINPGHVQAINNLGAALAVSGRLEEARDAYRKAVELQPASVELRMNLALADLRLGDAQAAAAEREEIAKLDPAAAQQLVQVIRQIEAEKGAGLSRGDTR